MNIAKLSLVACPSLLAVILLPNPAHANQPVSSTDVASKAKPTEIVFERPPESSIPKVNTSQSNDQTPTLDFTEAESKAAIDRFSCDCNGCISAVRELQGKLPLL